MLQIYQIITIWKYLNKLFLFTSQKRQNKRGHFKASFYSSPLFYPIAPTKPIVQLIRAYFTPISSMQNNQCEVLYPNCEPTSHFSPSFQSKMRSKWEALWFFVFLPVLLYLLYINIIRVIGFTFRISSYTWIQKSSTFFGFSECRNVRPVCDWPGLPYLCRGVSRSLKQERFRGSCNNFGAFYPSYKLFIAKKPYICLSFLFIGYVQN